MDDIEVLNYINENAEMGFKSIRKIICLVDDCEFKNMLSSQYSEYRQISDEAKIRIESLGGKAKEISLIQTLEADIMIKIKTLKDNGPSKISEMLMQGSLMGIIQITKIINKFKERVSDDVYNLAEKLLLTEQNNIDECKKYL